MLGLGFEAVEISSTVGDELAYGDAVSVSDLEVVGVGDGDIDGEATGGFVRLGGLFWGRSRQHLTVVLIMSSVVGPARAIEFRVYIRDLPSQEGR